MQVKMVLNARSRGLTLIYAQVEPISIHRLPEKRRTPGGLLDELKLLVGRQLPQACNVSIWRDHDMSGIIWVQIHLDDYESASIKNERRLILPVACCLAK